MPRLCHDLGYEDMDEFKDALHGEFEDFIALSERILHLTRLDTGAEIRASTY